MYMGVHLTFYCSRSFGVIYCISLKMACNTKTAGHRAKWSESWDSVTLVKYKCDDNDFVAFDIWSYFGYICLS